MLQARGANVVIIIFTNFRRKFDTLFTHILRSSFSEKMVVIRVTIAVFYGKRHVASGQF
jgi:hypothetical protein